MTARLWTMSQPLGQPRARLGADGTVDIVLADPGDTTTQPWLTFTSPEDCADWITALTQAERLFTSYALCGGADDPEPPGPADGSRIPQQIAPADSTTGQRAANYRGEGNAG